MSNLFILKSEHNYVTGGENEYMAHNPKVKYVCQCPNCGEYGTRSQYGIDEECPYCGTELDWSNEERW